MIRVSQTMKPTRLAAILLSLWCLPLPAADLPADVYPGLRGPDGRLLPGVAGHLGREVRIVERRLDPEMLRRRSNFGYSEEEIRGFFSTPVRMVLDEDGRRGDRRLRRNHPPGNRGEPRQPAQCQEPQRRPHHHPGAVARVHPRAEL
jgi:hypothetical protein